MGAVEVPKTSARSTGPSSASTAGVTKPAVLLPSYSPLPGSPESGNRNMQRILMVAQATSPRGCWVGTPILPAAPPMASQDRRAVRLR
jgi:hypothetical protein